MYVQCIDFIDKISISLIREIITTNFETFVNKLNVILESEAHATKFILVVNDINLKELKTSLVFIVYCCFSDRASLAFSLIWVKQELASSRAANEIKVRVTGLGCVLEILKTVLETGMRSLLSLDVLTRCVCVS